MRIKYLILSWHKNNLVIDGISEVGAEEGFLYLIIDSWQPNLIQTLS